MVRPLGGAKIEIMNDGAGTTWSNSESTSGRKQLVLSPQNCHFENQYFDFSHRLFS